MELIVIHVDPARNADLMGDPECKAILNVYPGFYQRVGFHPPWIGYFFRRNNEVIGCGGFKGPPVNGSVEISYGTFKRFEGRGVGTAICRALVAISLGADPQIRIRARTLPSESASTTILKRNDFSLCGTVVDDEDGSVWEWEYNGGRAVVAGGPTR